MIAEHAQASGVDLRYALRRPEPTTLAVVQTVDGEARYTSYDENTASRRWTYRPGSISFAETDAIHVGSTTLVDNQSAAQALKLVQEARDSTTISFDPNCRPSLVQDKADYVRRMDGFAASATVIRLSDSDFAYLYGNDDFASRAESLLIRGTSLVVVTKGTRGALAWHRRSGAIAVEAPAVRVVDTVGAGDSFQAGLLFSLRALGRIWAEQLAEMEPGELKRALAFAATCAAATCERPGADPPRLSEIDTTSLR